MCFNRLCVHFLLFCCFSVFYILLVFSRLCNLKFFRIFVPLSIERADIETLKQPNGREEHSQRPYIYNIIYGNVAQTFWVFQYVAVSVDCGKVTQQNIQYQRRHTFFWKCAVIIYYIFIVVVSTRNKTNNGNKIKVWKVRKTAKKRVNCCKYGKTLAVV